MKWFLIVFLVFLSNNPKEIAKVNAAKKEAEKAYLAGDYQTAVSKYHLLLDSMNVNEDEIKLNLAHAYYQLGDTANAKLGYSKLTSSTSKNLKSIAFQQLGVMSKDEKKLEQALNQLKTSIKSDPTNLDARYDYEVVKKMLNNQNQKGDSSNKDEKEEIEPSEYAKEMKEQIDNSRYMGKFEEALRMFQEAYQVDKTMEAYKEFYDKLQKVVIEDE